MTTPTGGFLNNLLGGVTGTLAGTNPLQGSVDQLTNAVNRLTNTIGTLNVGGARNAAQQQGGGNAGNGFPQVNVPGVTRQAGIGGGGRGGAGNVSPPMPFGRLGAGLAGGIMLGGAFAGYGQQQMPFQLGLNAYASMSMMGMNGASMGNFSRNFTTLSNQPGMPITGSSMDYLQMMQQLSFVGGAPNYMSTALGRAGFGGAAAFGLTNPALSGAASANLSQQIYNPMLSMRMRMLGYTMTPRTMGTGMPNAIGSVASSLIHGWYGRGSVNPSTLYGSLSLGGRDYTSLQYLGLNPQQMAPLLEGFNKLFNAGYTPQQASNLFTRAASNNRSVASNAQKQLAQLGVTSVSSDIQKLKNNQSTLTQRNVNTAAGFDAALTASTDSLTKFNSALNSILSRLGLNGALGAAGGFMGVLSGTNHGNFLQGLGGIGMLGLAARGAGIFGGAGGAGAAGGMAARIGLGGAGGLAGGLGAGALLYGLSSVHHSNGKSWLQQGPGSPTGGWNSWDQFGKNIKNWAWNSPGNWLNDIFGGTRSMIQNTGGGAGASVAQTRQQTSKTSAMSTSGASSSAVRAVDMAESQLGVPYVWGGEQPGVGFDCSGLVQWAYKQAGVNLPRTSEQQWASLKNKRVPKNNLQAGDIVFSAGSDGTPTNPGHEGMMVNSRQLIQAPQAGEDVQLIGYNPSAWIGAARPTGRGTFGVSNTLPGNNVGASALGLYGNTGGGVGNYGSVNEVDLISGTGGFMGSGIAPFLFGGNARGGTTPRGVTGPMGNGSKAINAEKAYAMQLLKAKHWQNQFGALNSIIMAESGWRWNAANPSGAYGIPQALPGSKMSAAGSDWRTNPDTQLRWLIDMYIPKQYGTPNQAWAFHQSHGWYGSGGIQSGPGVSIVGDRGPELMFSGGGSNMIMNNAQTMQLLKSISQPQQTPWKNLSQSQAGGNVITPGQPGGGIGSHGICVNVNFAQNSISVKMNNTSGSTDMQSVGKAIAQQTVAQLEREIMLSTIAQGAKN